jgi:hypothetical protein
MLIKSAPAPQLIGEPISSTDPGQHLLQACAQLGLRKLEAATVKDWKDAAQGAGNGMLARLLPAEAILAGIGLGLAATAGHWDPASISLVIMAIVICMVAQLCLFGTRWKLRTVTPEHSKTTDLARLPEDVRSVVVRLNALWRASTEGQWSLSYRFEYLCQPFWHRRASYVFWICGSTYEMAVIVHDS